MTLTGPLQWLLNLLARLDAYNVRQAASNASAKSMTFLDVVTREHMGDFYNPPRYRCCEHCPTLCPLPDNHSVDCDDTCRSAS